MQLKCWLLIVRILNIICASLMFGFELWYIIDLFESDKGFFVTIMRLFTPAFVMLLAFVIISSEFKYQKVVEHFKFLQLISGLALFNLFMASIMAFQFSTFGNDTITIVISCLFLALSVSFFVVACLRPAGSEGLLSQQ